MSQNQWDKNDNGIVAKIIRIQNKNNMDRYFYSKQWKLQ